MEAAAPVTIDEFLGSVAARFPDDADDLKAAQEVFQQQRLNTCERLSKLTDGQWQRLNLPIGIEALLRDEVIALTTVAANASPQQRNMGNDNGELPLEEFEPPTGLHRRKVAHEGERFQRPTEQGASNIPPIELTPPPDLEERWQELLRDTLPPDKHIALQEAWNATESTHDRYMMLLEYTSYLRKKPEASPEEQAEQRKRLEPLMRDLGINLADDELEDSGLSATAIWWLCAALVAFAVAAAYVS
eukprot:CAMPEP_0172908272 /NCGR_PEP_ID=MMETSP1075-20121228/180370_1 /TAXON_ID=2916 /ORGANISM="Ceratium fusus, Strain PA161109" /LENGTH=245 /DNA_ID=CAMNT_0013766009 /DNA_START=30 /DNA_END=763 /DNA_ORIENTATION=+